MCIHCIPHIHIYNYIYMYIYMNYIYMNYIYMNYIYIYELYIYIYIYTVGGERCACCIKILHGDDFPKSCLAGVTWGERISSRDILMFWLIIGHFCWQIHCVLGFTAFCWKNIFEETIVCSCGVSLGELFHDCDFAMWLCYV